ncbi:hypothetical protein LWC33_18030 [Pseudonocardia sp. RS11V-5]|uniref:hypothetical protein n=1 Tax=Pseudonocardia terrae TaxID=2905831 RepID=UPI001E29C021|nr:hypothetical protein [Pseudonocardia terrae]MCE3553351.1 hypothetical protein [Pseudonocardia terrae]
MSVPSVRPVRTLPTTTPTGPSRPVTTLATLGDSTAVGLGDPLPGGGRRGFPVLLRDTLGPGTRLLNRATTTTPACSGCRGGCGRRCGPG